MSVKHVRRATLIDQTGSPLEKNLSPYPFLVDMLWEPSVPAQDICSNRHAEHCTREIAPKLFLQNLRTGPNSGLQPLA